MRSIDELLKTENHLTSSLASHTASHNDISGKLVSVEARIKYITPLVVQYRGRSEELKDLQYNSDKTIRDIKYVRTVIFWKVLNVCGYSRERALINLYAKLKGKLLGCLLPDNPLPTALEDIVQINDVIKKARALLRDHTSLESSQADFFKETSALQHIIDKEKAAVLKTTRLIEDHYLVSGEPFQVLEEDIRSFKKTLVDKDPKAKSLTSAQWEFVTSICRNTYVIAGAGSGKSLSLVYRILFLYKCAGVRLEEITLFTFTRKTRMELVDRLDKVLRLFGVNLSEKDLGQIVHTFHSKAWRLGRTVLNRPISDYFEMYGRVKKEANKDREEDKDIETDQCLSFEISRETNNEQYKLLNQVYVKLFNQNERFKKLVFEFYAKVFMLGVVKNYKDDAYKIAEENDPDFTWQMRDFSKEIVSEEDFFEYPDSFDILHNGKPYKMHAHGKISLPLGGVQTEYFIHYMYIPEGNNHDHDKIIRAKKKTILITHDAQRNHVFIQNRADYTQWKKYKNALIKHAEIYAVDPPYFDYALPGYISPKLFLNILYAEGSFIENLGCNVVDTCENIVNDKMGLDHQTLCFAETLKIFWQAFTKHIQSPSLGIARFHEVFSSRSFDNAKGHVARMQNVLIDEFQDINPEISNWIKVVLEYLKHDHKCSITCVGDDYQSIYGWRGSAPVFFLNYEENFPSRYFKRIQLEHNFRSLKVIIKTGEYVLKDMKCAIPDKKKGIQGKQDLFPIDDLPVEIYSKNGAKELESVLREILLRYSQTSGKKNTIFVMSRTNDILNGLEPKFKHDNVEFMTYHRSKGLEADICILLNDSFYDNVFPLRNKVYAYAWKNQKDYDQSYDEAQKDEAKRLGYVAITRAMKKVVIIDNSFGKDGFIESAKEFATVHNKIK